jgi:hypothetical protein
MYPEGIKPEALGEGFDVILATPERVLVFQHRPDAEGLISVLRCCKAKIYVLSLPGRVLVELPRPSALRKRLMHFPFKIIRYFRISDNFMSLFLQKGCKTILDHFHSYRMCLLLIAAIGLQPSARKPAANT